MRGADTPPVPGLINNKQEDRMPNQERELNWIKQNASLRGSCDYCRTDKVLLAHNKHGLWECWPCHEKREMLEVKK
jgi:hypothetical protein